MTGNLQIHLWRAPEKIRVGRICYLREKPGLRFASLEFDFPRYAREVLDFEPKPESRLPHRGDGPNGLAALLLRTISSQGKNNILHSRDSRLARPLFDIVRSPENAEKQATWLQSLLGLADIAKKTARMKAMKSWFDFTGSGSGACRVKLKDNWNDTKIEFFDGKTLIPQTEYSNWANWLEMDQLPIDEKIGLQTTLKVEAWNSDREAFLPIKSSLHENDRIRLQISCNVPAYILIIWVDQNGEPRPVHPWQNFEWQRLAELSPNSELRVPNVEHGAEPNNIGIKGRPGYESIIVLVSLNRPAAAQLQSLRQVLRLPAAGIPKQMEVAPVARLLRPEDLPEIKPAKTRTPFRVGTPAAIGQLHGLVGQKLLPHFPRIHLFTFVNAGRVKKPR